MVTRKKELEMLLSSVPSFPSPSKDLEQYQCDSTTASEIVWGAYMHGDISGSLILDLGCGTGILSYGAALLGALNVVCIDIDCQALKVARDYFNSKGLHYVDFVCGDAEHTFLRGVDVVIMNPPFGVHKRSADLGFLLAAMALKPRVVYSIHKYNTRSHRIITETAMRNGYNAAVMTVRTMSIKATFEEHKRRVHRFPVALYRFVRAESQ